MIGVIVTLIMVWLLYSRRFQQRLKEPPLRPGALPIIGHAYLLAGDTQEMWRLIRDVGKDVLERGPLALQIAWKKLYVIADPISFQAITNSTLEKSELVYKYTKEILGDSLMNSEVPTWIRHRKILNPLFNSQVVDGYVDVFNKQAKKFVEVLDKYTGKGYFDVLVHLQNATLNTICMNMAGVDIDEEDKIERAGFTAALNKVEGFLTERIKKFWLYHDYIYRLSDINSQFINNIKVLYKFLDKLIQQKMKSSTNHHQNDDTHTFYEGEECILLPHALHRHPVWGDDAEEFNPERWLDSATSIQNSSAYAAFGFGRRNCIGQNYGMLFIEVMIVYILRKYRIKGDHKRMMNKVEIVLKPISGHHISVERRS